MPAAALLNLLLRLACLGAPSSGAAVPGPGLGAASGGGPARRHLVVACAAGVCFGSRPCFGMRPVTAHCTALLQLGKAKESITFLRRPQQQVHGRGVPARWWCPRVRRRWPPLTLATEAS